MRRKVAEQLGLVTVTSNHVRARELAVMSRVIDELPKALELVYEDLVNAKGEPDTGREAMTAEQVLRAMVIKQRFALSYEALSFELADSNSIRAFCRVPMSMSSPAKSTLQRNIKRVKASTWEQVNRLVIGYAQGKRIDPKALQASLADGVVITTFRVKNRVRGWQSVRHLRPRRNIAVIATHRDRRRPERRQGGLIRKSTPRA